MATKVNEKKFWQVPRLNWHVSSPIWAFFAPCDPSSQWKINSLKNFILGCESHSQAGSARVVAVSVPFLRYKLEKGLRSKAAGKFKNFNNMVSDCVQCFPLFICVSALCFCNSNNFSKSHRPVLCVFSRGHLFVRLQKGFAISWTVLLGSIIIIVTNAIFNIIAKHHSQWYLYRCHHHHHHHHRHHHHHSKYMSLEAKGWFIPTLACLVMKRNDEKVDDNNVHKIFAAPSSS